MHIHILGIGGTFMGGVAALAKAAGHKVTGQDKKLYPPMSTQLEKLGIEVQEYSPAALPAKGEVDMVVVGNVMSRGKPVVEALLNSGLPYTSGPQWLAENVLQDRWVLGVAGTHGKTTTSSMLAWILEYAGQEPGFLIGGVPKNFSESARLGKGRVFVVEADEYDSAFFDKRSKFVHYHPRTLIVNNIEFDHADIFSDLAAIQKQFHHLVRTIPSSGLIVRNALDSNVDDMLEIGCWTEMQGFAVGKSAPVSGWYARETSAHSYQVYFRGEKFGEVKWPLIGEHNVMNGLAAIAAAHHAGVEIELACNALHSFHGVKRRLEILHSSDSVMLYDDFAHHPTAIATTLQGIRANHPDDQIIAVFDPHSNTMKRGEHNKVLAQAFTQADAIWAYQHPELEWKVDAVFRSLANKTMIFEKTENSVDDILAFAEGKRKTHIVVMSNGGFRGMREKLQTALRNGE